MQHYFDLPLRLVRKLGQDPLWFFRYAKKRLGRRALHARAQRLGQAAPPHDARCRTLFFTPEAGVTAHFAAQCVLARTLQELGHPVLFVRCFNSFSRCPVKDMLRLPGNAPASSHRKICVDCAGHFFEMLESYQLPCVDMRHYQDGDTVAQVRAATADPPADLREIVFDSIRFGELAALDVTLGFKVMNFAGAAGAVRAVWLEHIESSITAYLTIQKMHAAFPFQRFVHFNDYSVPLGGRLAANKLGVPLVSLTQPGHCSVSRQHFVIVHTPTSVGTYRPYDEWPRWRDLSIPPTRVQEIADDIFTRLRSAGAHCYSPAKTFDGPDLRQRLGLDRTRKLLVAYTSSMDEQLAGEAHRKALGFKRAQQPQPFKDQIEWLEALVNHVAGSDDLQLLVRVHPREGAGKGTSTASEHLQLLRNRFDRGFAHCRMIWPEDPTSSYDLAEAADLVLTSWSSIGLELARLGVPVLASTNGVGPYPLDDFMLWGPSPREYFARLRELLSRSPDLDVIVRAYRCYNLQVLGTSIDVSDVIPRPDYHGLPPFRLAAAARTIEDVVVRGKDLLQINYERLLAEQSNAGAAQEKSAVAAQLRRLIRFLITGENDRSDCRLVLTGRRLSSDARGRSRSTDSGPLTISASPEDGFLTLHDGKKSWRRHSPLCVRILPLCAQEIRDDKFANEAA